MSKTLASSLFLLVLFVLCACKPQGTVHIHLVGNAGGYTLHSKAQVLDGVARFECRASSSGQCHFTLYSKGCDDSACTLAPLRRFALARGRTLQLDGVDDFRLCVSTDAMPQDPGCEPAASGAGKRG